MFDKRVVDSEEFYSLPIESQCLYFHLGMNADVHGFVQPLKICRLTNIKPTSLTPLIHQKFVVAVADGVILITHWNINNTVRIDREAPSPYTNLTQNLKTDDEGKYLIDGENGELLEYSGTTPAQYSIGKVSIGKNKLEENIYKKNTKKESLHLPTEDELTDEDFQEISDKYQVPLSFVLSEWDNVMNYCHSKAKKYSNYKRALMNFVKSNAIKIKKEAHNVKPNIVFIPN